MNSLGRVLLFDIEGDGLLEAITKAHCAVVIDVLANTRSLYGPDKIADFLADLGSSSRNVLVGHNIISFDLPALEKLYGFQWDVESCVDTLVLSRVLNPDLPLGHSLEAWGERLGERKMDYRQACIDAGYIPKGAPQGAQFLEYNPIMLPYCEQDTIVNLKLLHRLLKHLRWKPEELLNVREWMV